MSFVRANEPHLLDRCDIKQFLPFLIYVLSHPLASFIRPSIANNKTQFCRIYNVIFAVDV